MKPSDLKKNPSAYCIIDIREDEEIADGMIKDSHHIPLNKLNKAFALNEAEFLKEYKFQKLSKESKIVLYCASGGRSQMACFFLKAQGYHVENLDGGYYAYAN